MKRFKNRLYVVETGAANKFARQAAVLLAETLLNQLSCSVLAITPPGFVTPIILLD